MKKSNKKNQKNKIKKLFKCFYCNKEVTLEELRNVDEEIKEQEAEILEEIYDLLPKFDNIEDRKPPYTHISDLKYAVLNICKTCWDNAKYKVIEGE